MLANFFFPWPGELVYFYSYQMWVILLVIPFVSLLLASPYSWLLSSCPVCAASIAGPSVRIYAWLSPRLQFLWCSRLVRVRRCWHTVCSGNPFLGGNPPVHGVIGVLLRPYDGLPSAQCIEGSCRSTVISLCRPLWRPLASAAKGADSLTSRLVCLRRGGHPSEAPRFRSVGWHSCPG